MDLLLQRLTFTSKSTIGDLYVNAALQCYTLEDFDRDKNKDGKLDGAGEAKVFGKTAIPRGRYQVILSWSDRFKKNLPLLLNVPGFGGIRIHSGNTDVDTEGCVLVGQTKGADFIGNSRLAFADLMLKLEIASKREKIYITIK
jgi:hypothetical protein